MLDEPQIINLTSENESIVSEFVVKESQSRYGYLHFTKDIGFQDYIKDGREVKINYNDKSYMAKSYKAMDGRVNGLSSFFRENEDLKEDVKLEMELKTGKEPLELNIKKRTRNNNNIIIKGFRIDFKSFKVVISIKGSC